MANDTVQIQIQPEIVDVDATEASKQIKDVLTGLKNEWTRLLKTMPDGASMSKGVLSALNKISSAYKKASRDADGFATAVEDVNKIIEENKLKQLSAQKLQSKILATGFDEAQARQLEPKRTYISADGKRGYNLLYDQQYQEYTRTIKPMLDALDEARREEAEAREELEKYNAVLAEFNRMVAEGSGEVLSAVTSLNGYGASIENLGVALDRYKEEQLTAQEASAEGMNAQARSTNMMSQRIATLKRVAVKTFSVMKRAIQKVGSVISSLAGRVSSLFKHFDKGNKGLNINTKKLFKTFLQFGLGVRSLYFLIRRMRTELINGMKRMAASFPEVNAQVSTLAMSFNQLKGSAVTMLQPILTIVIPTLTRLMNLLSAVMTKLAQFFAILSGQKVIYKAAAANVDYAESVDGVGDSAKEANKELAEYDNLLVIPQDKAGSGGGGGGSGADDAAYTFDKVPAVSEFAEKLKQSWENADFEGVGRLIAEKLNSITQRVDDWIINTFEPKGIEWASRIARVGNGLFEDWNAELAGKTVSDFFNAIVKIVNKFATTFDWAQAGEKIGTAIITAIQNFDASAAGETVRNLFVGILEAGVELLRKNPGGEIGKKLADFINSLFDPSSGILGSFIGGMIKNVTAFFANIFNSINWKNIKEALQTNLDSLLESLGFSSDSTAKLAEIFDPIVNVFNNIIEWFGKIDFETILDSFLEVLSSITPILETIWNILEPVLTYAVNDMLPRLNKSTATFFDGVRVFLEEIGPILSPLLEFVAEIGTVVTELVNSGISDVLKLIGKILGLIAPIIGKILKALKPVISIIGEFLQLGVEDVLEIIFALLEPLGPILETIFDILGPILEVIAPILKIVVDIINLALKPLLTIIKVIIHVLTGDFEAAGEDVKELMGDMGKGVKKLKDDFKEFINKIINIWNNLKQAAIDLKNKVVAKWNEIKEKLSSIVKGIKETLTNTWKKIKTSIVDTIKGIRDKIKEVWNNIKTWIKNTVNGIRDKIVGAFRSVRDKLVGEEGILTKLKEKMRTAWENIRDAIKVPINGIIGIVETVANAVVSAINTIIRALNSISIKMPDWLKDVKAFGMNKLAGKTLGFNITELSKVSLPRLAQGAVIPPNKEFLAVLGDQSNGTNVEAPLDTIKQAVAEVLAGMPMNQMPEKIQVVLPNGKVLAQTVWSEERKYYKQTGRRSPAYS